MEIKITLKYFPEKNPYNCNLIYEKNMCRHFSSINGFFADRGYFHGAKHGSAVHGVPVRCSQKQPAIRGPTSDSAAGNESHFCSSSGWRNFRKSNVYALRSCTHRSAVRKSRAASESPGTLHRSLRHQKSCKFLIVQINLIVFLIINLVLCSGCTYASTQLRMASRLLRHLERWRFTGMSQSNVDKQHKAESTDLCAGGD